MPRFQLVIRGWGRRKFCWISSFDQFSQIYFSFKHSTSFRTPFFYLIAARRVIILNWVQITSKVGHIPIWQKSDARRHGGSLILSHLSPSRLRLSTLGYESNFHSRNINSQAHKGAREFHGGCTCNIHLRWRFSFVICGCDEMARVSLGTWYTGCFKF